MEPSNDDANPRNGGLHAVQANNNVGPHRTMKLGYKYYRNSFIKLIILSVAGIGIFWDYFTGRGHPDTQPGALILIAVIMVVGNVWLFIAMRRAKRREQAPIALTRIAEETHAITTAKPQPTLEEAIRKRK